MLVTGLIQGLINQPEIKLVISQILKKMPILNILKILRPAMDGIKDTVNRDRLPLSMTVVFANS